MSHFDTLHISIFVSNLYVPGNLQILLVISEQDTHNTSMVLRQPTNNLQYVLAHVNYEKGKYSYRMIAMIRAYLCSVCIKDRTLCHALASRDLLQGDRIHCRVNMLHLMNLKTLSACQQFLVNCMVIYTSLFINHRCFSQWDNVHVSYDTKEHLSLNLYLI